MKVTHLYTGSDGESHFKDIEISLQNDKRIGGRLSEVMKATGIILLEFEGRKQHDWHNASGRQLVITLQGESEIEVGDGTKRRFRPGDILLAEDSTGRGHISREVSSRLHRMVFVSLD